MRPTVVDIFPHEEGVSCVLEGEFVVPRLVHRQGKSIEVALVAGRAMLLPGDDVRIRITVGEGCTLSLVDIGGLIVYGRPGETGDASQWHARVDLQSGAHLTWGGLPTVVTDAGSLTRSLTVTLGRYASATLRETIVLGRTGERGGRLTADANVSDAIGPILRETLEVRGDSRVPGILGADRVIDSIIAVSGDASVADVPGTTRLELDRGGAVLRYLGDAAHDSPLSGVFLDMLQLDLEPAHVA